MGPLFFRVGSVLLFRGWFGSGSRVNSGWFGFCKLLLTTFNRGLRPPIHSYRWKGKPLVTLLLPFLRLPPCCSRGRHRHSRTLRHFRETRTLSVSHSMYDAWRSNMRFFFRRFENHFRFVTYLSFSTPPCSAGLFQTLLCWTLQ